MGWKDHRVWSAWEQEQNAGVGGHAAGKWNVFLLKVLGIQFKLFQVVDRSPILCGWRAGAVLSFAGGSQSS